MARLQAEKRAEAAVWSARTVAEAAAADRAIEELRPQLRMQLARLAVRATSLHSDMEDVPAVCMWTTGHAIQEPYAVSSSRGLPCAPAACAVHVGIVPAACMRTSARYPGTLHPMQIARLPCALHACIASMDDVPAACMRPTAL